MKPAIYLSSIVNSDPFLDSTMQSD